jgi:prepilin-type N-terminal cleavage/methylation domain-containing protein
MPECLKERSMIRVRRPAGFTLMEMMVVLAISLMMLVMIVPIFTVTTRSVGAVERKMVIYQAARNIIDQIENDVWMAGVNERGDMFNIKSCEYIDTDKNRAVSPGLDVIPGVPNNPVPPDPVAYKMSRRYASAINVIKLQGGGFRWANGLLMSGSQAFPNSYPEFFINTPEAWKTSIRSTLLYGQWTNYWQDLIGNNSRAQQLDDVGRIRLEMVNNAIYMRACYGGGNGNRHFDQVFNDTAPGYEIKATGDLWEFTARRSEDPNHLGPGMASADVYYQIQRVNGAITLMDFDVAYWDDSARLFKRLPQNSMISFSPPPKAIRITVTVCDQDKRMLLTLARVVGIAVGTGVCDDEGSPVWGAGQPQLKFLGLPAPVRMDTDPTPYNRKKDLTQVERLLFN